MTNFDDKLKKLSDPLGIGKIRFRVQSINKSGGATFLAYKNSRVDIQRLNSVIGAGNWQRKHSEGNANCTVSIWNPDIEQWVGKEDTGTESRHDAEKGKASDSFKRACFNWGIGIELYSYPRIFIWLPENEWELKGGKVKQTFDLSLNDWVWSSEFNNGEIISLSAVDEKGRARYNYQLPNKSNKNDITPTPKKTSHTANEKTTISFVTPQQILDMWDKVKIHSTEKDDLRSYGELIKELQLKMGYEQSLVNITKDVYEKISTEKAIGNKMDKITGA
ncbi:MAG: hypothetical protein QM504_01645 [Pseudomonadota bacterium]